MIFSTSVILSPRIDIIYPRFGKIKVENRGGNKKGAFVKQNLLKKCSIFLPSKIQNKNTHTTMTMNCQQG